MKIPSVFDPLQVEKEVLEFWKKTKAYEKLKEKVKGKKSFYFLDGPPYTTGEVHLGTAWNKSLKDMSIRILRMKGYDVYDRPGYDMHGLPVEREVEKTLGLENKDDIEKFGVANFVEKCKEISYEKLQIMNEEFRKLGVWMDFDNAYKSASEEFMDGVWFLIKTAYEKGRIYKGLKTIHWCARCATALAKHEVEYKPVKDNSIFVKLKVVGEENTYLLIWTTTPWTLAFNLGVMANPELDYVKVKVDNEYWILAKDLAHVVISGLLGKKYEIVEQFKGEALEGVKYEPLFDEPYIQEVKEKYENAFTVLLTSEYVTATAGSGLVHCAPGCGPEDYEVGYSYGLPPLNKINEQGIFDETTGSFKGLKAKKDDEKFVEMIEKKGLLVAKTEIEHDYPHCWRCKQPLVFRSTEQWFMKIEDLKEKMLEDNKKVLWSPDWAGSRAFENWLKNLIDNSISRQRYWGTVLPIWICDSCEAIEVFGSKEELEKRAGREVKDMHRPYIDEVTFSCKSCGKGTMKRVPDVLDVWIDAGTNSWTALDYPRRKDLFEKFFPADLIIEGKDQIRGWFNVLLLCSYVVFEKHPYKSVYMHGFINDALGRKMSKSLKNFITPKEVTSVFGVDAFRTYMISGTDPGEDINYNHEDIKTRFKNLGVLWNTHRYLIDLLKTNKLNLDTTIPEEEKLSLEDKYILSRVNSTIKKVDEAFEKLSLNDIPKYVEKLYLDISRIYIKLVRERIQNSKEELEVVARVLSYSFLETIKLFAPIAPFITEKMYQNLKAMHPEVLKEESVHHLDWPSVQEKYIDEKLESNFEDVFEIISSVLAKREELGINVRWPLKAIYFVQDAKVSELVESFSEILKRQTNVKEVQVLNSSEEVPETATKLDIANHEVYIETEQSEDLIAEGYAREIVRRVQMLRKKAKLEKVDRIKLYLSLPIEIARLIEKYKLEDFIKERTGSEEILFVPEVPENLKEVGKASIKGNEISYGIELL